MTTLYDYWRSSASYRLRIALELIGEPYEKVTVNLLQGEQRAEPNLARNPQGLVPTLEIDDHSLTQSLAILEYLDETRNAGFLPKDPLGRARVRAISYAIAMEIHPVCNLSVGRYAAEQSHGGITMESWSLNFIGKGLLALERMLDTPETGIFCHGDSITMADICLVPQVYNAKRWGIDLSKTPRLAEISSRAEALPAFAAAAPQKPQP